jgi:hypothetical protein
LGQGAKESRKERIPTGLVPHRYCKPASGLEHTVQFAGALDRVGAEHQAERARERIERSLREIECRNVHLMVLDVVQTGRLCLALRHGKHLIGHVDSNYLASRSNAPRDGERR